MGHPAKSGGGIVELFHEMWKAGKTIVIITHDMHIAKQTGRVLKLKDGLVDLNGNGA